MTNNLYNLFLANFFNIKGRSSRKEFICRFTMMWILIYLTGLFIKYDDNHSSFITEFMVIFLCIISIITILQDFFVTHRRLHDLNTSGWWQLILLLPLGQLILIGLLFFKGTPGPNKYGPPPEY